MNPYDIATPVQPDLRLLNVHMPHFWGRNQFKFGYQSYDLGNYKGEQHNIIGTASSIFTAKMRVAMSNEIPHQNAQMPISKESRKPNLVPRLRWGGNS